MEFELFQFFQGGVRTGNFPDLRTAFALSTPHDVLHLTPPPPSLFRAERIRPVLWTVLVRIILAADTSVVDCLDESID